MTPLADTHVHLLAGLDDGPQTADEAVAMCRMLVAEGARHATALAHQNEHYPDNTPTSSAASPPNSPRHSPLGRFHSRFTPPAR